MELVGVLVFSLLTAVATVCGDISTRIVATQQGLFEGSLSADRSYHEFAGIPYAVPVKFRAPKEPPSFSGVFKANSYNVFCPQFPSSDLFAAPSEDEHCLVLNVFTPASSTTNASSAVMVYLHGGDFGVGSGSPRFYGPQYLLSHDVILVTLNYRLNAYGFLNLGIEEAPGNAGLKDIRAALRWIKANVANFGGDPDNVTVFGQGSGGIAALYLTLSESTKGLCKRVISQSGSVFTPQSFDPKPLATASQIAKSLGVKTKDPKQLFKLYADTPVSKVLEAISKQMNSKSVFVPSVEKVFDGEEAFLTDTPYNILAEGSKHPSFNDLPAMVGLCTVEAMTCTLDYQTISSQLDRLTHEDFSTLEVRSMTVPDEEKVEYRKILKETYFNNGTSQDENVVGGMINLNTDFSYVGPLSLYSDMMANKSTVPVYEYIFEYIGNRNLGRLLTNNSLPATTHLDELMYLFELNTFPLPMDENDARIVTFMTMMWTNFAKFGKPTPDNINGEWLPYPHHLAILLEPKYVTPLTPERAYFWRSLYFKYGADILKN